MVSHVNLHPYTKEAFDWMLRGLLKIGGLEASLDDEGYIGLKRFWKVGSTGDNYISHRTRSLNPSFVC